MITETLIFALIAGLYGSQFLIYYKLGRIEQRLKDTKNNSKKR